MVIVRFFNKKKFKKECRKGLLLVVQHKKHGIFSLAEPFRVLNNGSHFLNSNFRIAFDGI